MLSSPRPNPELSLAFLFVTVLERDRRKSQHFKTSLPVSLRYGSWFIVKYTKAAKAKLNHRSKLWLCSKALHFVARFTIFTSRASQFLSRPFLNRCGFAVYTTLKPYRFEQRSTIWLAYSKRPGSDKELNWRHVNWEGVTASKPMRLQMKPRSCKQCLRLKGNQVFRRRNYNL